MKRFMTIISVLSILAMATSAFGEEYGFTISGSSTDPFDNAPPPAAPGGLRTLYLHYVCNNDIGAGTGMGAFESGIDFNAAPLAANTNPAQVFANVGDPDRPDPVDAGLPGRDRRMARSTGCSSTARAPVSPSCYRPTVPGSPGWLEHHRRGRLRLPGRLLADRSHRFRQHRWQCLAPSLRRATNLCDTGTVLGREQQLGFREGSVPLRSSTHCLTNGPFLREGPVPLCPPLDS